MMRVAGNKERVKRRLDPFIIFAKMPLIFFRKTQKFPVQLLDMIMDTPSLFHGVLGWCFTSLSAESIRDLDRFFRSGENTTLEFNILWR